MDKAQTTYHKTNEPQKTVKQVARSHRLPGKCRYNGLVLMSARSKIYGASGLSQFFPKEPPVLPSNFVIIRSSLHNYTKLPRCHCSNTNKGQAQSYLNRTSKIIVGSCKVLQLLRQEHSKVSQAIGICRCSFYCSQINGLSRLDITGGGVKEQGVSAKDYTIEKMANTELGQSVIAYCQANP
jgi:hypothetical protein